MKKFSRKFSPHWIKSLVSHGLHPQALEASTSFLPNPLPTDQSYALFLKSGHSLHPILSASLITHFSRFGDFSRSYRFLWDTQFPDIVNFNVLISGFARVGQTQSVFELFDELRHLGLEPDVFTLSSLVKGCDIVEENEIVHGVAFRLGFDSGAYLVSGFIENYSRAGDILSAEKCFEDCFVAEAVVCTTMVCGYVWNGEYEKSKKIFMEMTKLSLEINEFSCTGVLGGIFYGEEGKIIHTLTMKRGLLCGCSIHLNNAIINMYSRCGYKSDAAKVFDEMSEPDIVSWTGRIGAALDEGEALECFRYLRARDIELNEYPIVNLLSVITSSGMLLSGKKIQAHCHKDGHLLFISVSNHLISMYSKHGQMDEAKLVFNDMVSIDSVSCNSLIDGYSENGLLKETFAAFSQMRLFSFHPDLYTFVSLLKAAAKSKSPKLAVQIHCYIVKCRFVADHSIITSLIISYGKCDRIDEAKRVFYETDKLKLEHLKALSTVFVHIGLQADALNLFNVSRGLDLEVDVASFSNAIKACGGMTSLEQGRGIHSLAIRSGFDQDIFIQSALIDMYCKSGSLTEAEKIFKSTSDNLAAWNAMIMGYSYHGRSNEVFSIFNKMVENGLKPDEITFLGVLTSCRHSGLVKEARFYLNSMFVLHGVIPQLEHYASVVDLLGQVGLLEEAKRIIDEMPIHCDAHMWQILLSACSIHKNVELGSLAARKLLDLQPGNETAYLLLSNIHASVGTWKSVQELRKEMKEKIIRKEPGFSSIQVGRVVNFFLAGDTSHLMNDKIYTELEKLYRQICSYPRLELEDAFEVGLQAV